eukprot:5243473-Amphidinium_carterae.1
MGRPHCGLAKRCDNNSERRVRQEPLVGQVFDLTLKAMGPGIRSYYDVLAACETRGSVCYRIP